jgi:hypothetical protein
MFPKHARERELLSEYEQADAAPRIESAPNPPGHV